MLPLMMGLIVLSINKGKSGMTTTPQRFLADDVSSELAILTRMGDDALVLGQRLTEWCGHAPSLELDIAVSNLALDSIGQARHWLTLAGAEEGKGRSEDDFAFWRDARAFTNALLVEQPNGDFAMTMVRQFLYDAYLKLILEDLVGSTASAVMDLAGGMLDEVEYHLRYAQDWVLRLSGGTEESSRRTQKALDHLWLFTPELLLRDESVEIAASNGFSPRRTTFAEDWRAIVQPVLDAGDLVLPEMVDGISGGRRGLHSEHLQLMLAEMQMIQRTHPGLQW